MNKTEFKEGSRVRREGEKRKMRASASQGRFVSYINKILKNTSKDMTISSKAMAIMNSFVMDNFNKICEEASQLCKRNKSKTMTAREIQTAVRLILPGELARMACNEGAKAVSSYASKTKASS